MMTEQETVFILMMVNYSLGILGINGSKTLWKMGRVSSAFGVYSEIVMSVL